MMYSDSDAPTFNNLRTVTIQNKGLKIWRRMCPVCGWSLNIADYLQPKLGHLPCPKCNAVTNLEER